MNIGSIAPNTTIEATASIESKRMGLQVALLKKTLEAQQVQATELQRMAEGKGQVLDIRV